MGEVGGETFVCSIFPPLLRAVRVGWCSHYLAINENNLLLFFPFFFTVAAPRIPRAEKNDAKVVLSC